MLLLPKFFYKAFEIAKVVVLAAALFLLFGFLLKEVVEPLSPLITIGFVLAVTVYTFDKRKWNVVLPIGGIVLYLLSWPATHAWGVWPGILVWSLGVLLWVVAVAVYRPYSNSNKTDTAHLVVDHQNQDEEIEQEMPEPEVKFTVGKPVTYIPVAVRGGKKIGEGRFSHFQDDVFIFWTGTDDDDTLVHHFFIPETVAEIEELVTYVKVTIKGETEDEERKGSMFPCWKDGGLINRFYGFMSDQRINPIEVPDGRECSIDAGSYSGYFTIEDATRVESWLFEQNAIRTI